MANRAAQIDEDKAERLEQRQKMADTVGALIKGLNDHREATERKKVH